MSSLPQYKDQHAVVSVFGKAGSLIIDVVLFVLVLAFTGITVIAVAIAAPMAIGISAIVGRGKQQERRAGWTSA